MIGVVTASAVLIGVTLAIESSPSNQARLARLLVHLAGLVQPTRRLEFGGELAFFQIDLNETGLPYAAGTCTSAVVERITAPGRGRRLRQRALEAVGIGPAIEVPAGGVVGLIAGRATGRATISDVVARRVSTHHGGGSTTLSVGDRQLSAAQPAHRCGDDLVDNLSVAENLLIVTPREVAGRIVSPRRSEALARQWLAELGLTDIDPRTIVGRLGPCQRALVGLACAVRSGSDTVMFDDPSLSDATRHRLDAMITVVRGRGIAVVMASHDVPRIFAVADRVAVLRDGEVAFEAETCAVSPRAVIKQLVPSPGESPDD